MTEDTAKGERIAKAIARAGFGSRREAERWIAEGRVSVDGQTLKTPATLVTDASVIKVDGQTLPKPQRSRLFRFHKPRGMLTTAHDPDGRPTIYDGMPKDLPRLMPVGRLDFNSEGLLLLTNDGELKRHLELPVTGLERRYRVRVHGIPNDEMLQRLKRGLTIEGVRYGSIEATVERAQGRNCWMVVTLTEGKNREVRRVLAFLGLIVNRLIRVSYGPFHLGELPRAVATEVAPKMLRDLLPGFFAGEKKETKK
jgi:23S rRNA pseudouridine2605 synthase